MPVAQSILCTECREPIPGDAGTLGLCPRCLLRGVMSNSTDDEHPPLDPSDTFEAALPDLDVLGLIGQGGMGRVYQARQRSLDRLVAIKVFPRQLARDPSFVERFGQEARVLGSLSHPHIVTAHAFGQSEGDCYLVMEWIAGPSLRDVLRTGPLPATIALKVAEQVADALSFAHARGVIHRDIKPENILLQPGQAGEMTDITTFFDAGGRVRVADFGLSKLMTRVLGDLTLTSPQHRLGTPDYMAPEQRERPRDVDGRADIYALGVVLYEMLTGELPLGRFSDPSIVSGVDNRVDPAVLRCLEKDPGRRFQQAADLRRELAHLSAIAAYPPPLAYSATPDPARRRLRIATLIIAASVAMLLLAGAMLFGLRSVPKNRPAIVATPMTVPTQIAPALPPPPIDLPTTSTRHPSDLPTTPAFEEHPAATPQPPPPQPPGFPPPYRPTFGPPAFARDPLADMIARYGPTRIVTLRIDGITPDTAKRVTERLKTLTNAAAHFSSTSGEMMTIRLAPVLDVKKLADQIDFGKVKVMDPASRLIEIDVDPAKLPADAESDGKKTEN